MVFLRSVFMKRGTLTVRARGQLTTTVDDAPCSGLGGGPVRYFRHLLALDLPLLSLFAAADGRDVDIGRQTLGLKLRITARGRDHSASGPVASARCR